MMLLFGHSCGHFSEIVIDGQHKVPLQRGHHGVAHPGDQVDKVSVAMSFGQPDWIAYFGFKALLLQMPERFGYDFAGEEQVEIFGVAPDAGVLLQRERTGHNIGDRRIVELL